MNDDFLNSENKDEELKKYDLILEEIKEDEKKIERMVEHAEELAVNLKTKLDTYIKGSKDNVIFFQQMGDALQAEARLIDIAVNGRYKIATMRKNRAAIIKSSTNNGKENSNQLSLQDFLND